MRSDEDSKGERSAAVDAMAKTVGLDIATAYCDGVAANFARIEALASLVMAFPLPDQGELAVVFKP